jgi:L-iditol 2-dehydrogenase
VPEAGPGEVLVRIRSVGVCASDVHWWRDGRIGSTQLTSPLILGHEGSGTVEAVGADVTGTAPGQRVALEPSRPCRQCEVCAAGNYNVCPSVRFFGTPPTDGILRDYVAWPASLVEPIPEGISMDEAAMVEPLAIGIYAVDISGIRQGDTIAVLGAGAIGLSVLQAARAAGAARILVSEPVEARRAAASRLGADTVCRPEEAERAASGMTAGRGFDVVFECAGEQETVRQACVLAKVLGRVVIVGIPKEDDYPFEASAARRKQLTAVFARRSNLTTRRAIELVQAGAVDLRSYVTHIFPLERTEEALRIAESKTDGVIRAVIRMSE